LQAKCLSLLEKWASSLRSSPYLIFPEMDLWLN
jgi:hypothetical protein